MSGHKIHFSYESGKDLVDSFAHSLIANLGQADLNDAETVVSIGGDGQLLKELRRARQGQKICGILPPESNSQGFWTNSGIKTITDVMGLVEGPDGYDLNPLKAKIEFADGSSRERYAFNDVSVRNVLQEIPVTFRDESLEDIDLSMQSSLLHLKVAFTKAVIGPYRIMGTGLMFSTALGSTAMNRNYNGPSVDIRQNPIILTGMGVGYPAKGFTPIINAADTIFDLEVGSPVKRPVMMTFDSHGIISNEAKSPIAKLTVSTAYERTVRLLLNSDPGIRAYSAMTP